MQVYLPSGLSHATIIDVKKVILSILIIFIGTVVISACMIGLYYFLYSDHSDFPDILVLLQGSFSLASLLAILINLFYIARVSTRPFFLLLVSFISCSILLGGFSFFASSQLPITNLIGFDTSVENENYRFDQPNSNMIFTEVGDSALQYLPASPEETGLRLHSEVHKNVFLLDLFNAGLRFLEFYSLKDFSLVKILNLLALVLVIVNLWTIVRFTKWPLFNVFMALYGIYGLLFYNSFISRPSIQSLLSDIFKDPVFPYIPAAVLVFIAGILFLINLIRPSLAEWKMESR